MSEGGRPKILIVHPVLPYPPNQGSKVATFGLIRSLRHEYDVTVLCKIFSQGELADARELEQWCERVVTVMAPSKRSLFHRAGYKVWYYLKSLFARRSLKGLYDCPGVFTNEARALARDDFDLVIVIYWQLHHVLQFFPPEKCVLATYDIDLLINRQISLLERHLFRKLQAVRAWLLEQKEELAAYRSARRVWTLTERDKSAVETICRGQSTVDVMPFRLDAAQLAPPGMARNPGEILFFGYLQAPFNRDALDYFVRRIYPHLDEIDGLSITVVGGKLPTALEYFGLNPEVEIVGRVPDVRPYLHRAACIVIPLRFAGGLRIRILEAMAAGIPVVCSTEAMGGMPFEPEVHYLLADEPKDYASQIERVLGDGELARRISGEAMGRAAELYGAETQARRTVEMVREALEDA
jgi:glycosyltransferase involved in cell wall biosynthesis